MKSRHQVLCSIVLAASSAATYAQTDAVSQDTAATPPAASSETTGPALPETSAPLDSTLAPATEAPTAQAQVTAASEPAPLAAANNAPAPTAEAAASSSNSGLSGGMYIAPMGTFVMTDSHDTDNGYGGTFALGYRRDWYAFEGSGSYAKVSAKGSGKVKQVGGNINFLAFPFDSIPFYGLIGAGGMDVDNYPATDQKTHYSPTTVTGGGGFMWKLGSGSYEFALRTEALYRYGRRERQNDPYGDTDAPKNFNDVLINIGLQLPLSKKGPDLSAQEPPATVVPPPVDTDGDGVPDDVDQCPGTPIGTPVDAKGCPLPPPPPPCKAPEAGERVSLAGCGAGDVIVLRGVNFEFNKSKLTPNAKAILDGVAEELKANQTVQFEIGGHTDAIGSDEYNDELSKARAASVVAYLKSLGVSEERMSTAGYGETQPIADNDTEEGRELNRRVELKVTNSTDPVVSAGPAPKP